jgi:hypothetical protein
MRGIDLCFAYGANATSGIGSEGMCYGVHAEGEFLQRIRVVMKLR